MVELKKQSERLGVPILGGNTQTMPELEDCVAVTVFGRLITDRIVPDGALDSGDKLLMLGAPVEGDTGERCAKAKSKFESYLECVKEGIVKSAKDASRGGWFGNLLEMLIKSKKGAVIKSVPHPLLTRYLGTYIVGVEKKDVGRVVSIAAKNMCPVFEIGEVLEKTEIFFGDEMVINKERLEKMIKEFPYSPKV